MSDDEDPIGLLRASRWFRLRTRKLTNWFACRHRHFLRILGLIFRVSITISASAHLRVPGLAQDFHSLVEWLRSVPQNRSVKPQQASADCCPIAQTAITIGLWTLGASGGIVPEDVRLIELNSSSIDVAFSMGFLLDSSKWNDLYVVTPSIPTKVLMYRMRHVKPFPLPHFTTWKPIFETW